MQIKRSQREERIELKRTGLNFQWFELGINSTAISSAMDELVNAKALHRIWSKDGSLWTDDQAIQKQIEDRLGWLFLPFEMEKKIDELEQFAKDVRSAGFTHVVHMGMGGSSLAPMVFQKVYGSKDRGLPLFVLDSTDPTTIAAIEKEINLSTTMFIVASKSGSTIELRSFMDYFYHRLNSLKGNRAGENFVVITDPGTTLVQEAQAKCFYRTFLNFPDVGGRYSALSYVGLVPAVLMGLDIRILVESAIQIADSCGPHSSENINPGFTLGAVIGEMARIGRDKLTFIMAPGLTSLGLWIEQLVAESTGKDGLGIVPIVGEQIGKPSVYDCDRLFVRIFLNGEHDPESEETIALLKKAHQPIITIQIPEITAVVQEFFRWEFATALAGVMLKINPFDQPNVQEAKDATNIIIKNLVDNGAMAEAEPSAVSGVLKCFSANQDGDVKYQLQQFLSQNKAGDYFSIQAYLPESSLTEQHIEDLRSYLRDISRRATTNGYGPRFLHSTGQLHKGGPNTGLFIQLTAPDPIDIDVPDQPYSFGTLKMCQAMGDFVALQNHRRRVIRIDLGKDLQKGFSQLKTIVKEVMPMAEGV
jgi:glucose-6-phosphate isomerase